jgi:hypothetical protein
MALVGEARFERDLGQRQGHSCELLACPRKTQHSHLIGNRAAAECPVLANDVCAVHPQVTRQVARAKRAAEVPEDEFVDLAHPARLDPRR